MPFPDYDFTVRLTSATNLQAFVASQRAGTLTNCINDNGRIHIYADNHRLRPGPLNVEFTALIPDENFADGTRRITIADTLDIHLVPGKGRLPADIEASLRLPEIKVYPEEWMQNVKETADKAAGRVVEFAGVVDDSTPLLRMPDDDGIRDDDGAVENAADGAQTRMITGGVVPGGGMTGGGMTGGVVPGISLEEILRGYLGGVYYHCGMNRFVVLEKLTGEADGTDDETPEARTTYRWADAGELYNEEADGGGNMQPRSGVVYVDARGYRYTAVSEAASAATGRTLRQMAFITPTPEGTDVDRLLKRAEATADALQTLYSYTVVAGVIRAYEFVTTRDADGNEIVDPDATMALITDLLDSDFGDCREGELVYDPYGMTMWVRRAYAPSGWDMGGFDIGGYYLDMQDVLTRGTGLMRANPQPRIVQCSWDSWSPVFSRVRAEQMTPDNDSDYTSMVNQLLTTNKLN